MVFMKWIIENQAVYIFNKMASTRMGNEYMVFSLKRTAHDDLTMCTYLMMPGATLTNMA